MNLRKKTEDELLEIGLASIAFVFLIVCCAFVSQLIVSYYQFNEVLFVPFWGIGFCLSVILIHNCFKKGN